MSETITLTRERYEELTQRVASQQAIIDRQNQIITARNAEIRQLKRQLAPRKEAA